MADRPLVPAALVRGARGAVVAPHHLATQAGLAILEAGGHAVDAAIATNAVLAVVMPNACGIGGDAFWLIWSEPDGRVDALNGSGRSAATASADVLRAQGLERLPLRGPLSITVPGAVRSWADAHERFGRLSLDVVLTPAIELAAGGFPAWDGFIEAVERSTPLAGPAGCDDGFEQIYRPNGRRWRPGERVRLPALAGTLRRLSTVGLGDLYDGELAERQAGALEAAGSAIRLDDLRAHTSTWGEPISTDYRGTRVLTHGPNSSGIVALQLLSILRELDPPPAERFGPHGVEDAGWIHVGIEAAKLAMADRDRFLCDPEHTAVPVERLLDEAYGRELAARIDRRRAAPAPPATVPRGGGTIYLGVVDAEGNAVSLIESNYSGFGSLVADPTTGIHYQNRGSFFSLAPGAANELAPRKRPLHTLMPALLMRGGRPWIVTGSMGGDAQPQVHAQVVSALVDGGVDVATAVAAPRWFVEPARHFAPPIDVRAEPRFAPGVLDALRALGHPVTETAPFDSRLGHAHAIELLEGGPASVDGSLVAATDPRSAGLPAVR
ncbi:MAG TPA: gamma-glutamyltransferase [Candidatus Limnocylindrales bacterium]|nr:gamma-glutamyltransferase [Candidatus Limnocylindrales bacterium]